ncbi:MAG: hypothetical protein ABSD21_01160 [Rhizomicrobium sp.]|jgi:hypothetical protein
MLFAKKTVFAAAAFTGLMFASAAYAADASIGDCVHLSRQVASAIDAAQSGKAKDDARAQQRFGREYCAFSMYEKGVAHYVKALELLGQQSKS